MSRPSTFTTFIKKTLFRLASVAVNDKSDSRDSFEGSACSLSAVMLREGKVGRELNT